MRSYKATFYRQEYRGGSGLEAKEIINYRFLRDHAVRMEWIGPVNRGQQVLYVHGRYGNQLNIKTTVLGVPWHGQRAPNAPAVRKNANHPITESGFGQSLLNIRALTTAEHARDKLEVVYDGRGKRGPDGQPCFKVTRRFEDHARLTRAVVWFDEATLMPVQIEGYHMRSEPTGFLGLDRTKPKELLLERYVYHRVVLNPVVGKGRPELTVRDFQRKNVFLDHKAWAEEPRWKLEDIAPVYLKTHQTVRF